MMGRIINFNRAVLLAAVVFAFPAFAQIELPDSARPGAVRPGEVKDSRLPQAETVPALEIPAVIDRPFEIDEGDHVVVKQFNIVNGRDLPSLGIRLAEVKQSLQEMINSKPEGFTIGQMTEAADQITAYYRGKGLILATAVVPVQTVDDGIVNIEIYEGKLGRILIEGNEMYSEKLLQRPFRKLVGKPITSAEIESAILTLTDYFGLTVFGIFTPGVQVGMADIVLRVQDEKRLNFDARADNHGTRETGRARVRTTLDWNNPTGGSDRFSVTYQQSWRPRNNFFQAYDYERYMGFLGLKGGLHFDRNNFDVGGEFARQNITGETNNAGGFLEKSFIRSRRMNFSTRVDLTRKDSFTRRSGTQLNEDRLTVLTVEGIYDSVDIRLQGLNFATVKYHHGFNDLFGSMGSSNSAFIRRSVQPGEAPSRRGGSGQLAPALFTKVSGTYTRLQSLGPLNDLFNLENQFFDGHSILINSEFQWSDDLLVPLEQFSVGGADSVRAYGVAERLFDKAFFYSIEYMVNAPFIANKEAFGGRTWGELVQLSAFYDFAVGKVNDPIASQQESYENFRGAGFGLRFNVPGLVSGRIISAWAIHERESTVFDEVNNRRPQIWGDITFSF